ncbi:hypothetical protein [Streptosporangium sp. NPDC001681]|uniref:hypothetical protein n=1 Tax=Streptosporangium sp. NPDC001681 TaxID=3154395 RepID=UPI003322755C
MLIGVTRRGRRPQPQPAQVDLVTAGQAPMREGLVPVGGDQHGCAELVAELHGTGQEIGVQVRVGSVRNRQAAPPRGGVQGAQVAAGVHGQATAIAQVNEVGAVAQSFVHQRYQLLVGNSHGSSQSGARGGGTVCRHLHLHLQ